MHETGVVLMISVLVSYILQEKVGSYKFDFDEKQLFYLVIPPIIFSAGFNMKKRKFFKNLPYITAFGLLGTVFNFMTMSFMMYIFNEADLFVYYVNNKNPELTGKSFKLEYSEIFLFSGLITSSDVVAPLTLISKD